jgi:hypothetical protein
VCFFLKFHNADPIFYVATRDVLLLQFFGPHLYCKHTLLLFRNNSRYNSHGLSCALLALQHGGLFPHTLIKSIILWRVWVVHAPKMTGSSLDDWIYYQLVTHSLIVTLNTGNTALLLIYTVAHALDSQSPLVVSQQRLSTQKLPQSHTSKVTHKVFNSHNPLFTNYEPSTVVSHLELADNSSRTSFSLSYKPLIWHAGKGFNCCVTADVVTWSFPTLALSKCL